jgi:hypothetical protein
VWGIPAGKSERNNPDAEAPAPFYPLGNINPSRHARRTVETRLWPSWKELHRRHQAPAEATAFDPHFPWTGGEGPRSRLCRFLSSPLTSVDRAPQTNLPKAWYRCAPRSLCRMMQSNMIYRRRYYLPATLARYIISYSCIFRARNTCKSPPGSGREHDATVEFSFHAPESSTCIQAGWESTTRLQELS